MCIKHLVSIFLVTLLGGCSEDGSGSDGEYEGDDPLECSDNADNDRDGLFDCADEGCAGAANCIGQDSASESGGTGGTDSDGPPVGTTDRVAPMPVISRNVPSYASGGPSSRANDELYETFFLIEGGLPSWLAYDLSGVPEEQRGWVVVLWVNDSYNYSGDLANVVRAPGAYTIDAHAGPGGAEAPGADDAGWVTLADVTNPPNVYHSRQHLVNLTDGDTVYNWIRIYVTAPTGSEEFRDWGVSLNMDVHDAHLGVHDSWLFSGDSITNGGMLQAENGDDNFAQIINQALPDHFPAQENCGVGGWRAEHGAEYVPLWIQHFPGRYVALSYGTNDSGPSTPINEFYADYEIMVNAVLDAGKIPIVPTIPWFRSGESERVPPLNEAIADLKEAYPEILDGPDFWTYFYENQHLISDDDLHPSEEGFRAYRRLWAETMLEEVYQLQAD